MNNLKDIILEKLVIDKNIKINNTRLIASNINDGDTFEVKCKKSYKDAGFTQRRIYNGICKLDKNEMKTFIVKNDRNEDITFFQGIRFNGTFQIININ